jgi:hypothetical protein
MPWKRAKALPPPDNTLFEACFRIQREASEATGRHVPLIIENVCGAQKWVGRARWHFGSFYLWGDVPALMPITMGRAVMKEGVSHRGNGETNFHGSAERATKNAGGSWYRIAHNTASGHNRNPVHSPHFTNPEEHGVKQPGIGGTRKNGKGDGWFQDGAETHGSKSPGRKAASARIAKIPFALARHVAAYYKPAPAGGAEEGK